MAGYIDALLLLGCAISAQALFELNGFTMVCNPPIKFSGNDNKQACIKRCTSNPNCQAAVYDYNEGVNRDTCAIVEKGAKCGPTVAYLQDRNRPYMVTISNVDSPAYTPVHQVEVEPIVGNLQPVTQGVKKSMTIYNGPFTIGEDKCEQACKLHTGCNGVLFGGSMAANAGSWCVLKQFTKPLGKEATCVPARTSLGPKWNSLYFENVKYAPKVQCLI
ncbi:uncharacterized protein LOC129594439 [Paramacrobiotus metropolitanus]|uniref:uncharacterized protein LOC129594439 n=1 Tax=Paramacrobiotus metropolitanus TaxID=2943436 RepID=UPI00244584CF|nr:uncharacterized protein LOC129594439 [Paramacrobiotus metropolitanus]